MAGMLASAAFSSMGSIMQGQEQGGIAKYNAAAATQDATAQELAAKSNAAMTEQDNARRTGEARAAMSASGIDANKGSPLSVMHDLTSQGELSKQLTVYQGQNAARTDLGKAALDRAEATDDETAGWIQAGSTVLTAGDNAAQTIASGGSMY